MNSFYCLTRASTLVSAITLLTQVPVQKFPFIIIIPCAEQGIIDMNRNGNSANFFSYVRNGKKVKSGLPLL